MSADRNRDELVEHGMSVYRRLGKHLTAVDAGDPDAVDDLSVILRQLVPRGTRGDNLIGRLASLGADEPTLLVGPRARLSQNTYLSIASLPHGPFDGAREVRVVPIGKWLKETVLVLPGVKRPLTWIEVIRDYGSKFGAHFEPTRPVEFTAIRALPTVGSLDFTSYLIRQAACALEVCLGGLLVRLGGPSDPIRLLRPWRFASFMPYAISVDVARDQVDDMTVLIAAERTRRKYTGFDYADSNLRLTGEVQPDGSLHLTVGGRYSDPSKVAIIPLRPPQGARLSGLDQLRSGDHVDTIAHIGQWENQPPTGLP